MIYIHICIYDRVGRHRYKRTLHKEGSVLLVMEVLAERRE